MSFTLRQGVQLGFTLLVITFVTAQSVRRSRRARWWEAVDGLCQCSQDTRGELSTLARVATGALDRVALQERRVLEGVCSDLHAAVDRRSTEDELLQRPLRVTPGRAHGDASRDLGTSLDALCGGAEAEFWARLDARLLGPQGDDPRVTQEARRHVLLRASHCARRSQLSRRPMAYTLTLAEARTQALTCGRAPRR
ncbi:MAG: hypothetical protein HY909_12135 [Deltaproteobacteria bacterium]|nr:hypothetical protein [Deltaproteobacteria bacterium]